MTVGEEKQVGQHKLICQSLEKVDWAKFLDGKKIHAFYSDPPWGDGLMKYFASLANRQTKTNDFTNINYKQLLDVFVGIISSHVDGWVFIETGYKWQDETVQAIAPFVKNIKLFDLVYSGGNSVCIVGSTIGEDYPISLDGLSGQDCSIKALEAIKKPNAVVFDPCCGMGYVPYAAKKNGMIFYGGELNPERIKKTVKKLNNENIQP